MLNEVSGSTKVAKGPKGQQGNQRNGAPAAARRPLPFLNDIRDRAYEKWTAAGRPPGDGARFWLEAEQEIRAGR